MLTGLKGLGFSRAAKFFPFVIPSRPQPRLRGEDGRGICISLGSFRSLFSRWGNELAPE